MGLALTIGRTRREIAEDLGIGLSTLTRWFSRERDTSEPVEASVDLHADPPICQSDTTGPEPTFDERSEAAAQRSYSSHSSILQHLGDLISLMWAIQTLTCSPTANWLASAELQV